MEKRGEDILVRGLNLAICEIVFKLERGVNGVWRGGTNVTVLPRCEPLDGGRVVL